MTDAEDPPRPNGASFDVEQRRVNDGLWRDHGSSLVTAYAHRVLRPVEVMLLVRHREALGGRVLELGSGAGRLTGYLIDLAASLHGIDISPAMVDYCRAHYPAGTFSVADLRQIGRIDGAPYDVVVAPNNILDVLSHDERTAVLDALHGLLAVDGRLILSTHNRGYASHLSEPLKLRGRNVRRLVATTIRLPRWRRNRRRVLPFQHIETEYAILNDISHDFALLHYYISRDAMAGQLSAHGFELIECLDLDGHAVDAGDVAAGCPELHYVARRMERV